MQFHIENMTCGGCVRGVARAIQTVDPTATVDADPASRRVTVQSSQPSTAFLPALEAAGFSATIQ
ncbi:copper chaperone [Gemmobacter megaterium]|jgi:copper chaperone|uniref:Copper chaperone n=2 Tax=Paracoccaceae TaxID=31989 RepID=A0A1N7QJM2_9RHOB|nr:MULTISPECIES: heavy-metal-associated domain-containing protein [Paracoccaceae]MDX5403297.1 heavy-metal-associated domain-containing protein [Rhodobacterales bacterium]MDO9640913.1 heavy-metal-associated domain-containing protein [Pseudotabrizicola sp.]MDX5414125.1 heavy-metal-associated domain-containing protein [Rhodobacterales bacterium]SIT23063.1 copper chaperone [Gemmobacter megaterium]GGE27137.1 copper chaperone [Gemmobacter megaterium]